MVVIKGYVILYKKISLKSIIKVIMRVSSIIFSSFFNSPFTHRLKTSRSVLSGLKTTTASIFFLLVSGFIISMGQLILALIIRFGVISVQKQNVKVQPAHSVVHFIRYTTLININFFIFFNESLKNESLSSF